MLACLAKSRSRKTNVNATEFQCLEHSLQAEFIHIFRKQGASWRQLERLTGLSREFLTRL
jgi:hypothetical protein